MRKLFMGSVCGTAVLLMGCSTTVSPVSDLETATFANEARNEILTRQTPITQSISLHEAMARALKHNLDHRVTMMEADLANADYDVSRWDMLPKVVANGQYFGRSNEAGARSLSLLSGRESEQLANEALIQEERRRKAIIKIMEDVHRAYYRAMSSERLSSRLAVLESEVSSAFQSSREQFARRRTAPMPALSYQRELNDIQGQAERLSRDMQMAKMELAALMGLSPDQQYNLQIPEEMPQPSKIRMSYEEMIDEALRNRPEVRESIYAQRIGEKEIKKAVLEALPSAEGFFGLDTSSNDFLFNSDWAGYGARASWNLLNVFSTGKRKKNYGYYDPSWCR